MWIPRSVETYGLAKPGARFGHTNVRGFHPLLATLAGSDGERQDK